MGFRKTFTRVVMTIQKYSPQILAVAGTVGTVAGAVLACNASADVSDDVEGANAEIELCKADLESPEVQEDKEQTKALKKAIREIRWKCFKKVAPKFVLPILLIIFGLGALIWAQVILSQWLTGTTVAYKMLEARYDALEEGVRREYGEEALERLKYGCRDDLAELRSTDSNGIETARMEAFNDVIDPSKAGKYTIIFDKSSCRHINNADYCENQLHKWEGIFTDQLRSRGALSLATVLDQLDVRVTDPEKLAFIHNAWWVCDFNDKSKDCHVDLRFKRVRNGNKRTYENGFDPVYILDPNWDTLGTGNWDKICKAMR